jgi:hypothetical protein
MGEYVDSRVNKEEFSLCMGKKEKEKERGDEN